MKEYDEICNRKQENRQMWLGSIIIAALSGVSGLLMSEMTTQSFMSFSIIGFCLSASIWSSNLWVSRVLDRNIPIESDSKKRLILQFTFNTAIAFVIVLGFLLAARQFFEVATDSTTISSTVIYSLIVTLLINMGYVGRYFFIKWKESILEQEKIKNLHVESQLEALKAQMDPHFLFNALTTLSELVYEDQDQAAEYIEKLSLVYRYILDHKKEGMVTLSQELKFLKAYSFLLEIKYGDGLHISWPIDNIHMQDQLTLPVLASQIALENVVKHNLIESHQPITVNIHIQDDYLIIQNKKRLKTVRTQNRKGTGLENLNNRYSLLAEKYPETAETTDCYTIKLPLKKKEV